MFDIQREELDWCGRKLVLETGRIARQADGAVLATWGETTVLATVVAEKQAKPGQDFFPLTVHYQEKTFAAGRIPGGYLKREGRPSERETLTSRLIDRPIRPLFPDEFRCDTQVIATVLSYDLESDSDILALVASSAALTLSGVPFMGPVGAARVGFIKGEVKVNPTVEEMKDSTLDLVVAGTADAVLMVESEAQELAEETMLKAVMAGHAGFQPVIDAIIRLAEKAAKEPRDLPASDRAEVEKAVLEVGESRSARRLCDHPEAGALRRGRRRQGEGHGRARAGRRRGEVPGLRGRRGVPQRPGQGGALEHPRPRPPHRRARSDDRSPDPGAGRRAAAHPRLVALHPRRDAGAGGGDARHRRGRAVRRLARRHLQGAVPAPLQLPALLGRRDRPHGHAGPARDRPRQARLARDPPDAADRGGVPLHDPRRLGDHRVRTARPRWRRCAAPRSR